MLSKAIIATFLAASAVALDVQPLTRACDHDNDCVAASRAASAPVYPAEMVSPSSDDHAERVAGIA